MDIISNMTANFWITFITVIGFGIATILILTKMRRMKLTGTSAAMAYRMQVVIDAAQKAANSIIVTDSSFRIVFWNNGAEHLLGWREDEVLGKLIAIAAMDVTDLVHRGTPIDTVVMNKRGKNLDVNITISEISVNNVIHYTIIMKSIAERILIQRQHEQELSLYHDGEMIGCVGFWSWDISTRTVRISAGFRELFEVDGDVEDVEYLLKRVYFKDKASVQKVLNDAIEQRNEYMVEYRISKLNGDQQWVRSYGRPYLRDNGTVEKLAGVIIKINKKDELGVSE